MMNALPPIDVHVSGHEFYAHLKSVVNHWIQRETNGIVLTGPFAGMKIVPKESWDDGNMGCKLLGIYEQELHGFIEEEIERLALLYRPTIVNVGCAEGYYAVGLARRLPEAQVWALDKDVKAGEIALENAAYNEVTLLSAENLDAAFDRPDLVVMDCEGGEFEYLDPERYPGLANAKIILECHPLEDKPEPIEEMVKRFKETHTIKCVREGPRDPNEFTMLKNAHSFVRWLAVCEGRPLMMEWLVMRPR